MLKAFKYRIYPTPTQIEQINKTMGCCRKAWNICLDIAKKQQDDIKLMKESFIAKSDLPKYLSGYDLTKQLTQIKKQEEFSYLKEVSSKSLEMSVLEFDQAMKKVFREGAGFPKFKKKGIQESFSECSAISADFNNKTFTLTKKLKDIKCNFDLGSKKTRNNELPWEGELRSITISKSSTYKYYASFLVNTTEQEKPLQKIKKKTTIGIDLNLGLDNIAVLSKGDEVFTNPKAYRKLEPKIKYLQKLNQHKVKGSKRWKKANKRIAKVHEKISNIRTNNLHAISNKIVDEKKVSCIKMEDLKIKNMMQNHKLAKSFSDASLSELKRMITYKAKWRGVNVQEVVAAYTSQDCSKCGHRKTDLTLKDRVWTCPKCGEKHVRDKNASKNIEVKPAKVKKK